MNYILSMVITVVVALAAIIGHELAHAVVSTKLGDPTPKYTGRLTLNPLAHLDPVGTILMIVTGFGWARAVEVNPMYYKDRKKGMALVAVAGPLSNLLMAFVGVLIAGIICSILGVSVYESVWGMIFFRFALVNLRLMVFNLIPIPPLDGSKILGMFLPNRIYYNILQYERYAIYLIMLLSVTGVFSTLINGGVTSALNMIFAVLDPVFAIFANIL